ncbi:MAG: folate-binding protein YgfZ [Vicinamibacteria bacterium]
MSEAAAYRAAREGAALVDLPERGLLAASGPQRQRFLHSMLSNAVLDLQPGQGRLAALMDVKGHLTALMRVLATPDALLLELPKQRLAKVEETLVFYRVGAPVRFAAREAAVLGVLGPGAPALLESLGLPAPREPQAHAEATLAGASLRVSRATDLPAGAFVVHAPPETAEAVRVALKGGDAVPIGRDVFDALRVEEGRPLYGVDVAEEHLLHETGLLAEYHSSSKGCYLGQEVVARLEGRGGNVNKQLRGLRLGAAASAGAPVLREGREVGRVTTAAVSPRIGPIALACVHRNAFEPGTAVEIGGVAATVTSLPFST